MARKNPLGKVKDAALGTAKGGVELGMAVAGQVASKATDTVTSLMPGRKAPAAKPAKPAQPAAASRKSQGDPVAPAVKKAVAKAPAKAPAKTPPAPTAQPAPVTAIDAEADASAVDVTLSLIHI